MITWGTLLLDLAKNIAGLKGYLVRRHRENRERIATYFDQISSTLLDAATAFERDQRPWDKYREIEVHLEGFFGIVGDTFPESATTVRLWHALASAMYHDERLLGGSREEIILSVLVVRPKDAVMKDSSWRDNPVRDMDNVAIHSALREEVDRIREVGGLFRGYAAQLRARE